MAPVAKRTFSLPSEHAKFIDKKVASGTHTSGSEVVRAGLRALQERDAAIERWLCEEAGPAYDAMRADPSRAIAAKEAFAAVKARHTSRRKTHGRAKA